MDSYSFFVQDDWRLGSRFVLERRLRYDYHGYVKVYPTTDVPVEIVNYEKFTDINKLDFGPLRDPMEPYNPTATISVRAWGLRGRSRADEIDRRPRRSGLSAQPAPDCDRAAGRGKPVRAVPHRLQPHRVDREET